MDTYRNFVGGRWIESASAHRVPNRNPADTDDVLGEVALSTPEELAAAVEAAHRAAPVLRATPAPARARMIARAARLLEERAEEVAAALTREEGKVIAEARAEVLRSARILEFAAGEALRLNGETTPTESPSTFVYTLRQPVGVVAAITPWNFPVIIPAWKLGPALAAGCPVVWKPATLTPLCARLLVEIFVEAGVPDGALNLVYAAGPTAGEVLPGHPAVRALSFTGSNEVGLRLYAAAAAHGKKVQCEMGGKNAVCVLEDADLARAADGIAAGAWGSTGQRCTATSRVVALSPIADRLVELLRERAARMRPGIELGPLVDETQLRTVEEWIAVGRAEGARLSCGGERLRGPGVDRGFFLAPAIFDHARPAMRIAREEIFGPVLTVLRVADFDEALRVTNDVRYGLSAAIYGRDPSRLHRFVDAVETGIAHVNRPTVGADPQVPFGGVKETGVGARELGRAALEFYSEPKTVYFDYSA